MASNNLNRPTGFVPPYPVTPPATPGIPTNANYFNQQPSQQPGSITSQSTTSPPPRPPKLPNNPTATNGGIPPPLPARNGTSQPPQQQSSGSRPSSSSQKPLPDPSRHNRPSTSDGRPLQHNPSASVPVIPQIQALAGEDGRRRSEDQVRRRPSHPYGLQQEAIRQQQQQSAGTPPRVSSDLPPPPPPKPFQSATDLPSQMSQATLSSGTGNQNPTQNGEPPKERRRGSTSKGRPSNRPHLSEMDRLRRQKNATRSRLRILSLGTFPTLYTV